MKTTTEQPVFATRGRIFLRWMQRFFLVTGMLAVSYVGLTLLRAKLYQENADDALNMQIEAQQQHRAMPPQAAAKEGDVLGRIEIPRLGMTVAILEGTTQQTLRLGIGHIDGTALPGEAGNIGLAGHRDTYFRALKDIRIKDEIQIETASGLSRYEVESVQIVAPSDTGVLAPSAESTITLVTCYPFHFIGAAPERYIVRARRTGAE